MQPKLTLFLGWTSSIVCSIKQVHSFERTLPSSSDPPHPGAWPAAVSPSLVSSTLRWDGLSHREWGPGSRCPTGWPPQWGGPPSCSAQIFDILAQEWERFQKTDPDNALTACPVKTPDSPDCLND